jgi:hypothetical protein
MTRDGPGTGLHSNTDNQIWAEKDIRRGGFSDPSMRRRDFGEQRFGVVAGVTQGQRRRILISMDHLTPSFLRL